MNKCLDIRFAWLALFSTPIAIPLMSQPGHSHEFHPSWGPGDTAVVFYSDRYGNNDLFVISTQTNWWDQITSHEGSDENPTWSPTGEYIAFHSDRYGNFDIFIIKPDGTDLKRLTTMPHREMSPSWSPDGSKLIYEVDTLGNWQLFTIEVESGQTDQLTFEKKDHLAAAWNINGDRIFYGSSYRGAHQTDVEIFSMSSEGGDHIRVTERSGVSSNIAFSPSSSHVIFNTRRDGNWELYKMTTDGKNPVSLTTNSVKLPDFEFSDIDGQPSYSYDANRVAFLSGRNGSFDILTLDLSNSAVQNLTKDWMK